MIFTSTDYYGRRSGPEGAKRGGGAKEIVVAQKTPIEWTETTWNPLTGCTKISPGCKRCYAERLSKRLKAMGQKNYRNGFKLTLHEHMLNAPLQWRKPQMIFVNS